MAGGNKQSDHGTMAERLERTRAAQAEQQAQVFHGDPIAMRQVHTKVITETPARHVQVDTRDGMVPGLLVDWQQRDDGWWGQTWFPARDLDDGAWVTVLEWVPADHLELVVGGDT